MCLPRSTPVLWRRLHAAGIRKRAAVTTLTSAWRNGSHSLQSYRATDSAHSGSLGFCQIDSTRFWCLLNSVSQFFCRLKFSCLFDSLLACTLCSICSCWLARPTGLFRWWFSSGSSDSPPLAWHVLFEFAITFLLLIIIQPPWQWSQNQLYNMVHKRDSRLQQIVR